MAGLPWFQLDTDFADSPKVVALAARLREPLADAYVARLYAYCYRHARDRFDAEVAEETIEVAVRWRGRRGTLTDALHAVGVLEREAGKVVVHGVKERLAPHLAKRLADAARQRKHREAAPESRVSHAGVTVDVTRDVTPVVTRESRSEREIEREKKQKKHAPDKPALPLLGFKPAQDMLVAVFREVRGTPYVWADAKDTLGLKRILSQPLPEIERRWRAGLASAGWKETATVAQLAAKWNDLAPKKAPDFVSLIPTVRG